MPLLVQFAMDIDRGALKESSRKFGDKILDCDINILLLTAKQNLGLGYTKLQTKTNTQNALGDHSHSNEGSHWDSHEHITDALFLTYSWIMMNKILNKFSEEPNSLVKI